MGGRNQQHTTNATAAAPPNNRLCHDEAVRLQRSSAAGLMNLLRQLGSVYAEVARFNFKEAIRRIQVFETFLHIIIPQVKAFTENICTFFFLLNVGRLTQWSS